MSSPSPHGNPPDLGRRYYGKYRGKVVDNIDLMELGRILVEVPALKGVEGSWALPCVPYAGPQVGFLMLPPIGANVWVEFEGGDPTHPIWAGCFWGEMEKPVLAATPFQKVIKTDSFTLVINDTDGTGGLLLEVGPPAVEVPVTITIDAAGLQIETAEAVISMSPEEITATIPPTTATLTEGGVAVETEGSVTVTASDVTVTAEEVTVTANITATGAVEVTGDVAITGAVELTGDLTAGAAVEIGGALSVDGAVDLAGAVGVEGVVNLAGNLSVEGAVEVAGAVVAATLTGAPLP
ncbi:hypothetical protein JQX13_39060 [Archangium violaceum]|uniref:phage baseplate assembly protein V n=1 Tax=Archangium violaceum TaxID=83451 RepID=UPI00193BAC48|nr:phage baseplate assembly protein V [Archangium violaceum]QRK06080.1 hypothetical protein JQX13_39060 [Archangium violaceum]